MSNYLADVVMPPPEPQPEAPIPEGDPLEIPEAEPPTPSVDEDQLEEISYDEEEDPIPEPTRKKKIPQDEIFTPPKVKTILDPESLKEPSEHDLSAPPKKPKQTRKKRGPATPEQLERLAKGRAKAAETRARKKKEKEEQKAKELADKQLVEAVREKERKKMRRKLEEPDEDVPAVKVVEKPVVVEKGYSQADLDAAVARAVEQSVHKVETLRKQRKVEKQKALTQKQHDAKVFQDINGALKNDVWASCFL
jgi:hypothetical protein